MIQPLTEQIFADVIKRGMNLCDGQIWTRDQNYKIPPGDGLFVVVGMVDSQIISNVNTVVPTDAGMTEQQGISTRENIQIDIFSRTTEAITRRWEILQSLNSVYSVGQQEKYQMRIFTQSTSFVNSSSAEGGSNLNRFSIVLSAHSWHLKEVVLTSANGDYFDDFTTRVDDENTIGQPTGLIEFEIT